LFDNTVKSLERSEACDFPHKGRNRFAWKYRHLDSAGTETRIAILENNGGRVSRARTIGFGVLVHNLWWIARTVRKKRKAESIDS